MSLKMDDEGANPAIWTLAGGSEKHWIECRYQQTAATVVRRLPKGLTQCALTYKTEQGGREVERTIKCE